jgi:sporadic carbohydrate cluster 2OG-Fe(II) oxygenase
MTDSGTAILEFDTERFAFHSVVLDAVNDVVQRHAKPPLTDLSQLHLAVPAAERREVEDAIYALFGRPEFQSMYDTLCAELIGTFFSGGAAYQHTPSVRIHMPGSMSVNYHTDEWYGHGHDVRNFWMPLVAVDGTASMYVLEEEESRRVEHDIRAARMSITEMNAAIHGFARPLRLEYGQIFLFNSHILHGTVVNDTARTRVSIDFRMLVDGADRGLKDPSFFVRPGERGSADKGAPRRAGVYVGRTRGISAAISQKYQQLICLRYAADRNLSALVLETELSTFDYRPVLWDLVTGTYLGAFETLILFSAQLLPEDDTERSRLLDDVEKRNLPLHFVCEDFVWLPGMSRAPIHEAVHGAR